MNISLHSLISSILCRSDLSHVTFFITSTENILTSLSYTSLWCLQYCYMRGIFIRIPFHEFKVERFHWCVQWLHFLQGLGLSSIFMQGISMTQLVYRSPCKHEVILRTLIKEWKVLTWKVKMKSNTCSKIYQEIQRQGAKEWKTRVERFLRGFFSMDEAKEGASLPPTDR